VLTYHTRFEHYAHFVNLPDPLFRNLISHILVRRFANKCDGVIVPTYSAEEYLRLIGVKSEIFVQPTGIEYERFRNVDRNAARRLRERLGIGDERVLVSVARLSREKNIDFMLDCVRELSNTCAVPFRFVIVGDGNEQKRLKQRIEKLGLIDTVLLAGKAGPDEMPLYYALGDIFLFASKTETQGMVILEAMATGLPVVAVRSSGIDDVVQDGVTGFKTPEDPEKWCGRIRELLNDERLRVQLSENAMQFAKNFSIEHFSRNIVDIYAYLLASRARQRQETQRKSR
jgi:glycosyltransferase involved in cell wall biosynthesis